MLSDAGKEALIRGLYAAPICLGATFTLIAAAIVLTSYKSYEELRRHPNGIVILRAWLDMVFAVCVIVESAMRVGGYSNNVDCRGFSFVIQFSILGSELCLFTLSTDLFTALRNPFVDYKSSIRKYRVFIFLVGGITAAALIGSGPRVYGITDFGICWIAPQHPSVANGYMWAFFYVFLLAIYLWAFAVLVYARRRLSRGLRDTYEARMTTFKRGVSYVLAYTLFWLLVAIVYWAGLETDTAPGTRPAAWLFSFLFCCRGVTTMGVWTRNHDLRDVARAEATAKLRGDPKQGKVNRQLQPHLNLALRKEVLHYTTLALRMSVVEAVGEAKVLAVMQAMKNAMTSGVGLGGAGGGSPLKGNGALGGTSSQQQQHAGGGGRSRSAGPPSGAASAISGHQQQQQQQPMMVNPLARARAGAAGAAAGFQTRARSLSAASATAPGGGKGGGGTDGAEVSAAASVFAPYNDVKRHLPDDALSTDWKPLNIALYAPLFERGGLYDLGDYITAPGSSASSASASAASGPGASPAKAGHSAAGAYSNPLQPQQQQQQQQNYFSDGQRGRGTPGASATTSATISAQGSNPSGGGSAGDANRTPTSAHEGVIKRPPLELHDLAPDVFARIRDLYGISPAQFLFSLSRTTRERFSEGASGAFLCFSHDMRFVIKTMEKDEAEVLKRMLREYLRYMRGSRDSLIIKFLACMSLRMYRTTLYFVVMENIFPTRATIHERFDLKGSWVGRSASKGVPGTLAYCRYCNESFKVGGSEYCGARPNRQHVANEVLKDNDLTFKLRLGSDKAHALGEQLRRDAAWLARMRVMDYSLLIGVHNRKIRIDSGANSGAGATGAGAGAGVPAASGDPRPFLPMPSQASLLSDATQQHQQYAYQHAQQQPPYGGRAFGQGPQGGSAFPAGSPLSSPVFSYQPAGFAPNSNGGLLHTSRSGATAATAGYATGLSGGGSVGTGMGGRRAGAHANPHTALLATVMEDIASGRDLDDGGDHGGDGAGGMGGDLDGDDDGASSDRGLDDVRVDMLGSEQHQMQHTLGGAGGVGAGTGGGAPNGRFSARSYHTLVYGADAAGPDDEEEGEEGQEGTEGGTYALGLNHPGVPLLPLSPQGPPAPAAGPAAPPVAFYRADEGGLSASVIVGPGVFYMGIIDILQEYNVVKKAERVAKTMLLLQDPDGVSVAPPGMYADRFLKRVVDEIIDRDHNAPQTLSGSASGSGSQSRSASAGGGVHIGSGIPPRGLPVGARRPPAPSSSTTLSGMAPSLGYAFTQQPYHPGRATSGVGASGSSVTGDPLVTGSGDGGSLTSRGGAGALPAPVHGGGALGPASVSRRPSVATTGGFPHQPAASSRFAAHSPGAQAPAPGGGGGGQRAAEGAAAGQAQAQRFRAAAGRALTVSALAGGAGKGQGAVGQQH